MAINLVSLNRKLAAIQAKNVADIVSKHVNIPFLGSNYDQATLQTWLDVRSNLLLDVKNNMYTDAQLTTLINNIYVTLTAGDKAIADQILANQMGAFIFSSSAGYQSVMQIALYHFVTQ